MQFAKRSSRPRTQLHPASSLADTSLPLSLSHSLPSWIETGSRPTPPFFTNIGFQAGMADAIRFIRVPPPPLPGIHIHAASISSVDSICIVKIGNYTVTRVSCPFVSLRFIRRIAITYYRSIRVSGPAVSSNFNRLFEGERFSFSLERGGVGL